MTRNACLGLLMVSSAGLVVGCGTLHDRALSETVLASTSDTVTYGWKVESGGSGDALSIATMEVLQEHCGHLGRDGTEYTGTFKGDVKRSLGGRVTWVNVRDVECEAVEAESASQTP